MKIKTVIFILQLFLCSCVIFYPSVIRRYSDKVTFSSYTDTIGFILDISEFQVNDKIFIKLKMNEHDARRNLFYYYLFSNEFSLSMEDSELMNANIVKRKNAEEVINNVITYYFEIKKTEEASYLYFIIETSSFFSGNVEFKNTEKDESKTLSKTGIILLVVFIVVFVLVAVAVLIVRCVRARKMEKLSERDEVIVGPQLYNQQQMNNMNYQQPMYGQPQYYGQTQQDQMIVYSQGTNPQENSPNQIETPNQGVVYSNQNNGGENKGV
jgi:hypothetical protein